MISAIVVERQKKLLRMTYGDSKPKGCDNRWPAANYLYILKIHVQRLSYIGVELKWVRNGEHPNVYMIMGEDIV